MPKLSKTINLFSDYIKKIPKIKTLSFFAADVLLISLAVYLAFLLRFDGQIPVKYSEATEAVIILALIICLPIFYFSKLYSFSWSYVSMAELVSLAKAVTLAFLLVGIVLYLSRDYHLFKGFPRSTLLISYFLTFLLAGGLRLSKRIYLQILPVGRQVFQKGMETERKRTLIVGAGDAAEQILRSIQASKNSSYLPVAFVDDSPAKQGVIIHGLKVFGGIKDIPKIAKENQIEQAIIALASAGSQAIKRAVEMSREGGIKEIKTVPSIAEIINGEVSIRNLRELRVEDLLGREPVSLDTESIRKFVSNKSVLITGAAGSIGFELSKQIAKFKPSLLLILDQEETGIFNISKELRDKFPYLKISHLIADIRDREKINQIFSQFRPKIVFHAAAYKHVPLMERHPGEAVKNNIFGTEIIARASLNFGAEKLIFISTDKAVNPVSVMGATKRVGEMICQALNKKSKTSFISVRFGNVLESRGSVIPIFKEQIKKGGPVRVTHPEMKRYFMTTSEACLLVMQAGAMGRGGEVFVLDMGKPINILDLAREMIKLSGFEPDREIPIVFSEPRPGEKFFEEILTAEEGAIATQNQKIFMAKLSEAEGEKLKEVLGRLKSLSGKTNKEEIMNILKTVVPFYKIN